MVLRIGERELKIKFAYEPTLKARLLSRLAKVDAIMSQGKGTEDLENIEDTLMFLVEFLLIGLQKYHRDEYGFDYDTGEGKEGRIEAMYALVEEYLDSNEDEDVLTLYNALVDELLKNGILKNQFKSELAAKRTQERQRKTPT